jgi:transcriptional regulator with PAS, ATPase and Fis domain
MASSAFKRVDHLDGSAAIIRSPILIKLMVLVERAAKSRATVLIQGETGSGKEMIARSIHELSSRRDKPFIDVNCAALPEHLIESELFGHEKGAFSGADAMKPGMFELADHGTLLLDEIGELDSRTQAKLLRVLDGAPFFRLGGTKKVVVDVRVIAATNRDLATSPDGIKFRSDLFFRLSQLQLFVPPLRERPEEIEAIAERTLFQHAPDLKLSPEAMDALMAHSWPGNIRELKNVLIGCALRLESVRNVIEITDLPDAFRDTLQGDRNLDPTPGGLDAMERTMIERCLRECGGDLGAAAEQLGISRRTMSRKVRAYDLSVPKRLGALSSEQHRYFRADLDRPVLIRLPSGCELGAQAVNLSSSGIGVTRVKDPSKCAGSVEMEFDLGEPQSNLNIKGRVSWTDADGGAGIRFVGLSRAAQQSIDDWITRRRVQEGWTSQGTPARSRDTGIEL